ncbi:MAG: right-handed parallel beta-helix repeat-containing protein [Anaerolineae bacterium]
MNRSLQYTLYAGVAALIGLLVVQPLVHAGAPRSAGVMWAARAQDQQSAAQAPQVTRTVCPSGCPYSVIQTAITASSSGDVVRVLAGVYQENITLKAGVSVIGSGPGQSIIDGRALNATVLATTSTIGNSTVVSGFTIRNGSATAGGGVRLDGGASPTIRDNIIENNVATTFFGGGMSLSGGSSARIEYNLIRNNSVSAATGSGGGVFIRESSNATLIGNRIEGNTANNGGGVYVQGSAPILTANRLANNQAANLGGGLILTQSSHATLLNNVLESNTSGLDGGGAIVQNSSNAILRSNVLRNNTANNNGTAGGIKFYGAGTPTFDGNWLEGNEGKDGGGAYLELGNNVLFANNVLVANRARNFGGAMVANGVPAIIRNNLIRENQAAQNGGGVYLQAGTPQFSNNTVDNNDAQGPGDGLVVQGGAVATVRENIITNNARGINVQGATVTPIANDVWNNTTNYINLAPDTASISQNPYFTSGPLGAFYLSQTAAGQTVNSPAVNAGARTAVAASVDTRTTRTDEVLDSGVVDMGFHYPPQAPQLRVEPSELVFHADSAGVTLPSRWLLLLSDNAFPLTWGLTEEVAWLRLNVSTGATPAVVEATALSANLAEGVYDVCVLVEAGGVSTNCLPVRLEIARTCSLPTDLDCDGSLAAADLVLLAGHWGEASGSLPFVPRFDLNSDGRISVADFILATANWALAQ